MQDALERAYQHDLNRALPEASKCYHMGLQSIAEGLKLQVPVSGLGPQYSNVARWRSDMQSWQQHVHDR